MKEYPILFQSEMVQAILSGRKTQTRRVLKAGKGYQSEWLNDELLLSVKSLHTGLSHQADGYGDFGVQLEHPLGGPLGFVKCPYCAPESILWVRETFFAGYLLDKNDCIPEGADLNYWYYADTRDARYQSDMSSFEALEHAELIIRKATKP